MAAGNGEGEDLEMAVCEAKEIYFLGLVYPALLLLPGLGSLQT